jgi:hypothetical protein
MSATLRKKLSLGMAAGLVILGGNPTRILAQEKAPASTAVRSEVAADPVLKAMREELDRSNRN